MMSNSLTYKGLMQGWGEGQNVWVHMKAFVLLPVNKNANLILYNSLFSERQQHRGLIAFEIDDSTHRCTTENNH